MSSKNLWMATFIVIGLGILSACAMVAAQAEDDGQVYENEEFGYSLRFPAECTFGPMPPGCKAKPPEERPAECLCFLNAENPNEVFLQAYLGEGELTLAGITIAHHETPLYNPPRGTDLAEWMQEAFAERMSDVQWEVNTEIDGLPALRITTPSSPMAVSMEEIYVLAAGRLFQIRLTDIDSAINQQFYDQLLSTLDFHE